MAVAVDGTDKNRLSLEVPETQQISAVSLLLTVILTERNMNILNENEWLTPALNYSNVGDGLF